MLIFNQLNNILDNLLSSLNDGSNTEASSMPRQIDRLNNDILGIKKRKKSLYGKRELLKNWS